MKHIISSLFSRFGIGVVLTVTVMSILSSCIQDGFTTSPSDQPTFSCDTLKMGDNFTLDPTPTKRFTVYNRHDKMLNISSIALRDDDEKYFRLNVDGVSARQFSNVEIRPNDSIIVFVEATLPENKLNEAVEVSRHLDFVTNGVTSTVVVSINGQDVERVHGIDIMRNTTWHPGKPYVIYDTVIVYPDAMLTIEPGTVLRFHDKAALIVAGTLRCNGTAEKPVEMIGDRDGNVAASIPYEIMSGQWGGIIFTPTSRRNYISHTSIRNSSMGIVLDSIDSGAEPALTMINSQVRNTTDYILYARHSSTRLIGCEFSEASLGILALIGGRHEINHCTIANYYLFTAIGGPAVQMWHLNADTDDKSGLPYTQASFTNSIIYGLGSELSHGDLAGTDVTLNRCLLKSAGTDDDNFINCIWEEDPLYYTIRSEYKFDYRLQPDSPAIGASDPSLDTFGLQADRYGVPLATPADLGAYTFVAQ